MMTDQMLILHDFRYIDAYVYAAVDLLKANIMGREARAIPHRCYSIETADVIIQQNGEQSCKPE